MSRWQLVGAAAAALVLGMSACGSSDDSSGETSAQGKEATATAPADDGRGTPKEQVEAFLVGLQRDFVEGDGEGFCSRLTAAGRRDATRFSRAIGRGPTCEGMVRAVARASREAGTTPTPNKVVSVKITGDRAIAVVRNGDLPRARIILINRDGQWKLPDPGFTRSLPGAAG